MAFQSNGTWVPDQTNNMNTGGMSQQQAPQARQMAPQQAAPQQMQQVPMQNPAYTMQSNNMQPNNMQNMQNMQPMIHRGVMPQAQQSISQMPGVQAANSMTMTAQPAHSYGMMPNPGGPSPGQAPQLGWSGPQQYAPQYYQPQPQQHSLMQSVNNANPQSVQNFLSAVHNTPGMSANNSWQNPAGMQGQGPQAGFQGFQQNGQQMPPQNQWQGYYGGQQPQLGSYSNQAGNYGHVTTGNNGNSSGGTGGVANQPGYTQAPLPGQPEHIGTAAGQMVSQMTAMSDVNTKTNITTGDTELQSFLDNLGVYSYEYKDPKYGEGRRISPMAQEIEQSALGKAAISTNAEGYKQVDYGKLSGTTLAAVAYEHHQIKEQKAALALLTHKYNELESRLKEAMRTGLKNKGK